MCWRRVFGVLDEEDSRPSVLRATGADPASVAVAVLAAAVLAAAVLAAGALAVGQVAAALAFAGGSEREGRQQGPAAGSSDRPAATGRLPDGSPYVSPRHLSLGTASGPAPLEESGGFVVSAQVGGPVNAVFEHDGLLYVGRGPRLLVYAVCPSGLEMVGASGLLPGVVQDVVVQGDVAFAAVGEAGLASLSLAEPEAPRLLHHLPIYGVSRKIVVDGGFAYLVSGIGGMPIVDIRDVSAMRVAGTYSALVSDIAVEGDWAFVVSRNLQLVNIADRTAPFQRAKLAEWADAVAVRDGRLFAGEVDSADSADRTAQLRVYDVRSPNKNRPQLFSMPLPSPVKDLEFEPGDRERLWILGRERLSVIQGIDSLASVGIVRQRPVPEPLRSLHRASFGLLIAAGGGGLLSVDPASADLADSRLTGGLASAQALAAGRGFAFVDDEGDFLVGDRLRAFDLRDPYAPREAGVIEMAVEARSLVWADDTLFAVDTDRLLRAFDVSDPYRPAEVGRLDLPKKTWALAAGNGHVFAAADDRVVIVDVRDPAAMLQVAAVEPEWGATDVALDVAARRAYATGPDSQRTSRRDTLHALDVAEPAAPAEVVHTPIDGWRSGLVAVDGIVFGGDLSLQIYDDRGGALAPLASLAAAGEIRDKAWSGDGLLLAVQLPEIGGVVRRIDVSDPSAPLETGALDVRAAARGVAFDRESGLGFVSAQDAGLLVFGLDAAPATPEPPPTPLPAPTRVPLAGEVRAHLPLAIGGVRRYCAP